jgi:hypothetical protein
LSLGNTNFSLIELALSVEHGGQISTARNVALSIKVQGPVACDAEVGRGRKVVPADVAAGLSRGYSASYAPPNP